MVISGQADAFLVCYSIAERNSFENISLLWAPELKKCRSQAHIILVGKFSFKATLYIYKEADVATKIDLLAQRKVTTEEGEALAKDIGAAGFIETSAKNQWNIDAAFQMALMAVLAGRSQQRPSKSLCQLL